MLLFIIKEVTFIWSLGKLGLFFWNFLLVLIMLCQYIVYVILLIGFVFSSPAVIDVCIVGGLLYPLYLARTCASHAKMAIFFAGFCRKALYKSKIKK